jgi:DNA-binding LacI/PurR family transcriptional regulator
VDTAADHGLGTSDSWIKLPDRAIPAEQYEEFGYQAFQEIWKNPQRPDGLLIYPDIVARGSVTAALHLRVSVPGELKLVLHRNKGIPLLCPLPATWVEFDPGQAASALVRQIECQLAGEPTEPIFIPHTLETPSRQPADHATP